MRGGAQLWDTAKDEELFRPDLERRLQLPNNSWDDIAPGPASDEWRTYLVKAWWPQILRAVTELGSQLEFLIPILTDGALTLVEAKELSGSDALPFTAENWRVFVTAAVDSGIRYSDLNETGLAWWGRAFPRGILRQKSQDLTEIAVATANGSVQAKPLAIDGSLALIISISQGHDHPDGPRYSVIHIPSGRAIGSGFKSEAAGEAAMRYANRQKVDWTAPSPDRTKFDRGFSATLIFIRESVEVPTDDAIRQYALQL